MRIVNVAGRLGVLVAEGVVVDVEQVGDGRWSADPQEVFARWQEFRDWVEESGLSGGQTADAPRARRVLPTDLMAPVPRPRQVFAVGMNYREHAGESGLSVPVQPAVFTKFPASIVGPVAEVELPDGDVDWEVELVAVIGRAAHRVREEDAWDHVAGLTCGQDVSDRRLQFAGEAPQFSLAKSYPGFAPMGPALVTPDEFEDPDDLELGCLLNGEQMQKGRTSEMVYTVPALVSRLSAVTPLLPGDVIFTGTPAGVGMARSPQRFLKVGDQLVSHVTGIGELRTGFVGAGGHRA